MKIPGCMDRRDTRSRVGCEDTEPTNASTVQRKGVRCAEQNLYTRAKTLLVTAIPRAHEFSAQLRAFDAAKSGSALGVAALLALCSALLEKSLKGGMVVVGGLNLGGSIEPVLNPPL